MVVGFVGFGGGGSSFGRGGGSSLERGAVAGYGRRLGLEFRRSGLVRWLMGAPMLAKTVAFGTMVASALASALVPSSAAMMAFVALGAEVVVGTGTVSRGDVFSCSGGGSTSIDQCLPRSGGEKFPRKRGGRTSSRRRLGAPRFRPYEPVQRAHYCQNPSLSY